MIPEGRPALEVFCLGSQHVLKHVRASQEVFRKEIQSAGFVVVKPAKKPDLAESFFLCFHKPLGD